MNAILDQPFGIDHDLRRLRAEIQSALRCSELLDRLGIRFRFWAAPAGDGVRIEVRATDGRTLGRIAPRQLLRLLEGGPFEIEVWAILLGGFDL